MVQVAIDGKARCAQLSTSVDRLLIILILPRAESMEAFVPLFSLFLLDPFNSSCPS